MASNQYKTHKDLLLWKKGVGLAVEVHRLALQLPKHELFGLASQLRRAAVSIPSNIAEGAGRRTTREFLSFLYIARGSWAELDTQLQLASELGYIGQTQLDSIRAHVDEVGRLLNSVINSLRHRLHAASD